MDFREAGPGRYQADLDGRSQGLLAILTGGWEGGLSTEMEYSEGKLRPLVYREISTKNGKKRVMEYRFDYAQKNVELFKPDDQGKMTKRWETNLNGPMYDPLTFFYNRRLTGAGANEKGGESVKFHSIPYPKADDITLRVGDQTPEGRKIMVDLGNRLFKEAAQPGLCHPGLGRGAHQGLDPGHEIRQRGHQTAPRGEAPEQGRGGQGARTVPGLPGSDQSGKGVPIAIPSIWDDYFLCRERDYRFFYLTGGPVSSI